jgi:hypothetical protein
MYTLNPLLFALAFYSWVWLTTGVEAIGSQMRCETKTEWFFIAEKLGLIDIVLTIFVPFLIIIIANLLISLKLMRSVTQRDPNAGQNVQSLTTTRHNLNVLSHESTQLTARNNPSGLNLGRSELRKRRKVYSKTTRMLLVISTVYIFLNAPLALAKLRYFVTNMARYEAVTATGELLNMSIRFEFDNFSNNSIFSVKTALMNTVMDELVERLTCYIYYLNFAVNFILYSINGPTFISSLLRLLKIRKRN